MMTGGAYWGMGLACEQKGMPAEAIAELGKADALSKHGSVNTRPLLQTSSPLLR